MVGGEQRKDTNTIPLKYNNSFTQTNGSSGALQLDVPKGMKELGSLQLCYETYSTSSGKNQSTIVKLFTGKWGLSPLMIKH